MNAEERRMVEAFFKTDRGITHLERVGLFISICQAGDSLTVMSSKKYCSITCTRETTMTISRAMTTLKDLGALVMVEGGKNKQYRTADNWPQIIDEYKHEHALDLAVKKQESSKRYNENHKRRPKKVKKTFIEKAYEYQARKCPLFKLNQLLQEVRA